MKIVLFLILAFSLSTSAGVYSQNQRVSLEFEDATILDVLNEIKDQTGISFFYNDENLAELEVINLDASDMRVDEVLEKIFENTGLEYVFEDEVILIVEKIETAPEVEVQQEKKTIKGKVTDDQGIPLPGVSVVIKGTNTGVATNIDGEYSLEFEQENVVLVYSFVGMTPQEIVYNGQQIINLELKADTESLSEVVITGYTKTSKVRQSSSSTKISSASIERQATNNLDESLEGLSTGLQLRSVNTDGGQEQLEIILRGISTFDHNADNDDTEIQRINSLNRQPLIVLDGFPYEGPFNDIDKSIIESIDVLKDAAATALWGLRASNGVIVITTKRGKMGKASVEYTGSVTLTSRPDLSTLGLASSQDVIDLKSNYNLLNPTINTAYSAINYQKEPSWWDPTTEQFNLKYAPLDAFEMIWANYYAGNIDESQRDAQLNTLGQHNVLNQFEDQFLRQGLVTQNSIRVSGGEKMVNYSFTASHQSQKRTDKGDEMERLNASLATDIKINDKLSFVIDGGLAINKTELNGIGMAALYTGGLQQINVYDDLSGNVRDIYPDYKEEFLDKGFDPINYNPGMDRKLKDNYSKNVNLRLALGLKYDINSWLSADVKYQINTIENSIENLQSTQLFDMRYKQNGYITAIDEGNGAGVTRAVPYGDWLDYSLSKNINTVIRGSLNLHKVIQDDHVISGVFGMEATESKHTSNQQRFLSYSEKTGLYDMTWDKTQFMSNNGRINDSYLTYGTFSNVDQFLPSDKSRTIASFSNLGYSYKAKYNLEASMKIAQASAFGINKKLSKNLYWAVSGSWNINKESFMDYNWLNSLKLRASYGVNGNMRRGLTTRTTIAYQAFDWLNQEQYARIDQVGNPNLAPETTNTMNLGLDFAAWNRLRVSLDVYSKRSSDLLVVEKINNTFGTGDLLRNKGEILNKGLEFSISADIIKKNDFSWNSTLNFSYNKNTVEKYGDRIFTSASVYYSDVNQGRTKLIGEDVSAEVRYRWAGLDENGNPQVYDKNNNIIGYQDIEAYNAMDQDDLVKTKPFIAPIFGGVYNTFQYKNWSLSTSLSYKFGHVFQENLSSKYPYYRTGDLNAWSEDIANAWTIENQHTNIPAAPRNVEETNANRMNMFIRSDYGLMDASYIRMNEVSVKYDFGNQFKKVGIEKASLMFQVRNLGLLWTANSKEIDPESIPFVGTSLVSERNFVNEFRPGLKTPVSYVVELKLKF
jgi:TonB-linked SusC/RagA family outer membrane protein